MTRMTHALPPLLALTLMAASTAAPAGDTDLTPVTDRPQAPALSTTDARGQAHRLADLRGKVVVVNFWATWCPPCRDEMPSFDRLSKALAREGVVVLGVNAGETAAEVKRFLTEIPVSFPLLLDADSRIGTAWGIRGLPTTFVIDTQGRIAYTAIGDRQWDAESIKAVLRALAREKPRR